MREEKSQRLVDEVSSCHILTRSQLEWMGLVVKFWQMLGTMHSRYLLEFLIHSLHQLLR